MSKLTYTHLPLSIDDQIAMLKQRGLVVDDEPFATRQLQIISYFRLASYLRPMEADKTKHLYKPNSTFHNAVDLYYFDKQLRALIFSGVQSVEIALRAALIDKVSAKYGAFWFTDSSLFNDQAIFTKCLNNIAKEISRSKEDFILEHFSKYDNPLYPPVWKTLEVVTFGTLSNLYCNLSDIALKKEIARSLGLPQHVYLESWMKCCCALRNCCAHHNRIWNRRFPIKPQLPTKLKSAPWITPSGDPYWLYSQLCCLVYLERMIHPKSDFASRLKSLLSEHPNVDTAAMGFPANWQSEELWKM